MFVSTGLPHYFVDVVSFWQPNHQTIHLGQLRASALAPVMIRYFFYNSTQGKHQEIYTVQSVNSWLNQEHYSAQLFAKLAEYRFSNIGIGLASSSVSELTWGGWGCGGIELWMAAESSRIALQKSQGSTSSIALTRKRESSCSSTGFASLVSN